jgi:RNA polymerase sigma-70 factor (ECF subfamily)
MLGSRDDACDAAQDAFLKCWRARDGLTEVTNLRAWIFRVGINTARDLRRSAYRRKARPLLGEDAMYVDSVAPPGERIEEQEDLVRLRKALAGLRDEEKEVFLLRQNGGLTYEQIAEARSSPIGTVKTQMRTALIKLRKVLAEA